MEYTSILDLKKSPYKGESRSCFFLDLNLNQIIDRVKQLWGEDVSPFYYYLPADKECEDYRREVFGDVKKADVYPVLLAFVKEMKGYRESCAHKEAVKLQLQKAAWHVQEVLQYGQALETLEAALHKTDIQSRGMKRFHSFLQEYLGTGDYRKMYEQAQELMAEVGSIHLKLTYENNLVILAQEETRGSYDSFLKGCFGGVEYGMKNPFGENVSLNRLEQEILNILVQKKPELFKRCETFYNDYKEYTQVKVLDFASEITYYLSFYAFEQKMQELGFAFATPHVEADREMFADGLYDLALACVNSREGKEVVSNPMEYKTEESFFVVTGPNQGGKTTFARSLGQLIYFTKMGLDVPALSANVHHFTDILTHFSVEESVETGRGKLQEELTRLKPMMEEHCRNAFVIINELFTTAANYDACIMGQRVLQHFIGQQCRGIYVTHLAELTQAHESVVSMCATLDEEGMQTHRIIRKKAGDVACAINQVNKYRLTYEQLKERLS